MGYQGLDRVTLGHIAAEEEADELKSYFIETEEYSTVVSDKRKILVTGRKGSGKSAIYVVLKDYLPDQTKDIVHYPCTLTGLEIDRHGPIGDNRVRQNQNPEVEPCPSQLYAFLTNCASL